MHARLSSSKDTDLKSTCYTLKTRVSRSLKMPVPLGPRAEIPPTSWFNARRMYDTTLLGLFLQSHPPGNAIHRLILPPERQDFPFLSIACSNSLADKRGRSLESDGATVSRAIDRSASRALPGPRWSNKRSQLCVYDDNVSMWGANKVRRRNPVVASI